MNHRWSSRKLLLMALSLFVTPRAIFADVITIDFEGLGDSTFIATQYPGVTFSNAIILSAGISLNELEFPPHSGDNVISDFGAPISITFSSPISSFGGFFTYLAPLTVEAFDSSSSLLASVTSQFVNNLACLGGPPCSGAPGSAPNEFLRVDSQFGISAITIAGNLDGASFALDDVTYSAAEMNPPEPSSAVLLLFGILALAVVWRRTLRGVFSCHGAGVRKLGR